MIAIRRPIYVHKVDTWWSWCCRECGYVASLAYRTADTANTGARDHLAVTHHELVAALTWTWWKP